MRKTQKSKIVILSILGLAAVSIGSIGFATWLVGINKTEEELHVEAVVDDTKNDSIYLDVAVANNPFLLIIWGLLYIYTPIIQGFLYSHWFF